MPKPTLVTGAAGFIAFHLISQLLEEGVPVLGVDNFDPFYPPAEKRKNVSDLEALARRHGTAFRFFERDIASLDATWEAGTEFGAVIHLAAKAGVRPSLEAPEAYLQTNVQGTLRILELCRHRRIGTCVFASSSSVYGDVTPAPFREDATADHPVSPYAASKRAGELYCATYAHLYGLRIPQLRLFTVYGPRQRPDLAIHKFAKALWDGRPISLFGDGSSERDYTFVSDIVAGIRAAGRWADKAPAGSSEIFNLGGGRSTRLARLLELVEKNLGRRADVRREPAQPGDVVRTLASLAKSTELLGYAPKVSIEQGIERFAAWFADERTARAA